eukprot:13075-Heterococcus_DN1.PRE.1
MAYFVYFVLCVQGFPSSKTSTTTGGRGIATISKSLQQQQQRQRKPQSTRVSRREQLLAIGSDKRKTASPTSSNNNSDDSDDSSVDYSFDFDFNTNYAEITDDATTATTVQKAKAATKAVVPSKPKASVYDVMQAELQAASAAALKATDAAAKRSAATAAATAAASKPAASSSRVSSDALTVHKRAQQQQQQQRKQLSPEAVLANSILKKQLHTAVRDATEPTVRLKSVNRFHRIVLSCWTDAQLMLSTTAAATVAATRDDSSAKRERALVPLAATRYSSTADYISVYQGLLLEEVRACIAESNSSGGSVKLRVERVDDEHSDSKFTYVTFSGISTQSNSNYSNRSSYGDNSTRGQYARDRGQEYDNVPSYSSAFDALLHHDVVLLTSSDSAGSSSMRLSQQQQQQQQHYRLAIVERDQDAMHGAKRYENANKIRLKLFLASGNSDCDDGSSSGSGGVVIDDTDAVVTISKKSKARTDTTDSTTAAIASGTAGEQQNDGNTVFIQGQTWTAQRLDSVTTSGREWVALQALHTLPLAHHILQACSTPQLKPLEHALSMHHMSPQYTVDRAHFVNCSERLCTLAEQCSDSSITSYLQLLQLRSAIAAFADMRVTASDFEHTGATRCLTALKKTHWDSAVSAAAGTVVARWKKLYQSSLNVANTTTATDDTAAAKLHGTVSSAIGSSSSSSSQGDTESSVPEKPALITLALWNTLCDVYNTAQLQAIWSAAASAKEKARYRVGSYSSSNGCNGGNVQQPEDSVNGGSLSCLCGPPGTHHISSVLLIHYVICVARQASVSAPVICIALLGLYCFWLEVCWFVVYGHVISALADVVS